MNKHRISYRDWLNRAPTSPGEGLAREGLATSGITAHIEELQATEHTDKQHRANTATTNADGDAAETAIATVEVSTAAPAIPTAEVEPAEPTIPADTAAAPDALIEHLVFRVGRELFALPLDDVEEAIDVDQVQRIPEMGAAMLGVLTLRGASVPLYAPAAPLGVAVVAAKAALIFVTERGRVALAVDDVDDVLVIAPDVVARSPLDFGDQILVGVTRRGSDLIGLLAAPALIAACRTEPAPETV